MQNPKFQIFNGSNNQFYYHLRSANGEKILSGEGYISKASCQNGIQSVKENSTYDSRYRRHVATNGQYYFVLTGSNGEIVGQSETYLSSQGRHNGIDAVKRDAKSAPIEDLTYQRAY
ncbi:MAG: YegP family protein [Thermoproteota archaeon]|nr:YegP family protein [Thermoproteota archaeon]